jgi:hypothetical protein
MASVQERFERSYVIPYYYEELKNIDQANSIDQLEIGSNLSTQSQWQQSRSEWVRTILA